MTEHQAKNIAILFLKFQVLWKEKWTKHIVSDEYDTELKETWIAGLRGLNSRQIEIALDECRKNFPWPCTPAEFRCLAVGGVTPVEAWQCVVKKDFSNPFVKLAYDKIGSWTISHDTEQLARSKFQSEYLNCIKNEQYREINSKAISSPADGKPLSLHYDTHLNATETPYDANRSVSEVLHNLLSPSNSELTKNENVDGQNLNSQKNLDSSDEKLKKKMELMSVDVMKLNQLSKEDTILWLEYDSERRYRSGEI